MHWQAHRKNDNFRAQIRSRQINEYKEVCRKKYLYLKENYELLKNISVEETIRQFKQEGDNQKCIYNMFLYASCKQSDYLYCLFDEGIVNSLMGHLEKSEQKQMGRKDNHILLILTNYSAYNDKVEYEQKYMDKLMSILNNNDRVQVMSSVVLNICNIVHNANECFKFLNSMDRVQDMVYGYQFCISKLQGKYEVYKQLAQYYGRFIESMYKHTYYDYIKENIQKSIIKLLIHIISIMPICRESECTNAKIMIHVLKSMQYLYGNSLDNKPQLIISHKKYIYRVCNWFQNYLKEYRSKQLKGLYQQVIVQYCKTLKILYGINVPQQLQEIQAIYIQLFNSHVSKICEQVFMLRNDMLSRYILQLLATILLQAQISQTLVTKNYKLLTYILYYISSTNHHNHYMLIRESLLCIINMIKTIVDGYSQVKYPFLLILNENKFSEVFASYIWKYTDKELNQQLLTSLQIIIKYQLSLSEEDRPFWCQFVSAGGLANIQKLTQESMEEQLQAVGSYILDTYRT